MKALTLALIPTLLLAACGRTAAPPPPAPETTPPPAAATPAAPTAAQAAIAGPASKTNPAKRTNNISGTLQLVTGTDGVLITGDIMGLKANSTHGFHVHENGDCSGTDFKSAGGHFNPDNQMHGNPDSTMHHLGDLPNIKADAKGIATVNATVKGATLGDGGPHDILGKSLVVHAKADDYKSQPAGNSGDRIACGVIERLP
ncbi:MAG TPA: superoxide dismutase family protein [Steroidobacteraceae bacterium]|nr:superoxide dismutase family protein [Steroidobacteraceae bacterium]